MIHTASQINLAQSLIPFAIETMAQKQKSKLNRIDASTVLDAILYYGHNAVGRNQRNKLNNKVIMEEDGLKILAELAAVVPVYTCQKCGRRDTTKCCPMCDPWCGCCTSTAKFP